MSRRSRLVAALAACGAFALGTYIYQKSSSPFRPGGALRHEAAARAEVAKEPRPVEGGPVDFGKLEAFKDWSRGYMAASAEERKAAADEGVALAKARRPEFLKLIKTDPARALAEAVPMVVRQDLPAKVTAHLEERVRGVGALRTYANTTLPGSVPVAAVHYLELNDGVTYQAYTSGREQYLMDYKANRSVNGVAVRPKGGMAQLALDPRPVRPLEVGERPDPALPKVEICPVSGNSTALPPEQAAAAVKADEPVVEAQGQVFYLCNGSHTTVFENQLVAGEGAGGGGVGFNGPLPYVSTKALGVMKVLYIPVTFPDENVAPTTEANAYNTMKDIADYYNKSSFGKLTIATTVTPCLMMPHNGKWYQANDADNGGNIDCLGLTHTDARAAAKAAGFDPANYDCIVVLQSYAYGVSRGAGGWGTVGGNSVWIYSSTWREVVAHEMGHTFGLAHANFWDSNGVNGIGYGSNQEYGDDFDIMGGGSITTGQYNIASKEQIKWFTADNLTSVASSGTYRIAAHDSNILDPALSYGLKIVKDPLRTYYAEVRQLSDADANQPWQSNGIRLEWKYPSGGGSNNQLIDTTPGSINGKADGNIIVGRTFSDAASGIHLTPVAVNKATSPKTVDVVVNLGQFPGNQPPTLALNASATNVPTGATVTFNAVANDPDGDALSYYWTYGNGDKTALPNAASINRTFSSAGQYQVTCTVSDMKGKTAVRSIVVNVGTNTTYSIGGRVTNGVQPLANIPVSTTNKETVTDSDGYYTLVGLAAGTYSVTPRLDGYSFTGSQGSSITVGPNTDTANFDAAAGAVVTITATVPTCTEDLAGSTGKFTLTRTGPTTNALAITMQSVAGTATNNTDYTLSPAISSNTLTIPAGAASLDVTVTPKTDASTEGPETVRLLLAQSSSYVIGGSQEATVTIIDNDPNTNGVKVGIVAAVPVTVENSATPALLRVSRNGPTTAALTVNYTVGGTATAGGDYTALPGSVTIPAGASSADIPVTSINDSASETNETVVVTLSTNAAYLIEASPLNAATATIVDDDLQILTVTTSDAIATEGASPADNGTFLVTRTGDTSQDLTLYYSLAGSALQGVDYVILPGSVTIPAGQTSAAVTIAPIDDGILEDDQTVTILLGSLGSNYKLGSNSTSTLTIKSNPANKPFVSVAAAEDSFGESGTAGIFRFAVSGVVTSSFTVNYTVGGSATPGGDYNALSGTVTIPAGSGNRTVDVTVTPINDVAVEDLEDVTLTITPSASYVTWPASDHATMWLYDDEQPTVFVDASNTSPAEPATNSKFTLLRTGSTTADLVVNYTMSGTATNGSDYTALSGTATIPAGKSFVDITVTPVNDTAGEGTETIILTLAPGAYSRSPLPATLYLGDNDTSAVTVGFNSAASTTAEGAGTVNIPVSLSAASVNPVTVNYVVGSGSTSSNNSNTTGLNAPYWVRMTRTGNSLAAYRSSDGVTWTQQGTTQTIGMGNTAFVGLCLGSNNSAASQATATFDNVTVTPAGGTFTGTDVGYTPKPGSWTNVSGTYTLKSQTNDIYDSVDSFYFVSTPVTGDCTVTARVTAISGGVAWTKAGVMIRESLFDDARHGMSSLTPGNGVAFQWRAGSVTNAEGSGVDFTLASGTLTFPAGTTTLNIPVQITDDQIVENTENVVVSLVNAGGAGLGTITQHILAISDNDVPPAQPTVGFAAAASSGPESNTTVNLPVALSFKPAAAVTVDYAVTGGTAVSGTDYTLANGTLTFNAGETVKLIPVTVVDDAVIEPDRTIIVGLSNPVGADLGANVSHTYTIANDDTPVVTITATDATAAESPSATDTGTFTVSRTGPTTNALTVNFTVSGTATSGTDYTAIGTSVTIPAGASSAPVTITPVDNATAETSETVIVTLAASAGVYTVGSPAAATVTITDDDMPVVSIVATDNIATETGATTGTFTVSRTGPTTNALTVNFTVSGSATSGSDYTSIGTSVSIPSGSASKTITLTPINDSASEGDEYVLVALSTNANYTLGAPYFDSITIEDDDFAPYVQITSPLYPNIVLPAGAGLLLEAAATDDGLPAPMTYSWTKVSGPGTVAFGTPAALNTTATFSANGTYVVRFSAYDGNQTSTADQIVNVGGTDTLYAKDIGSSVSAGSYSLNEGTGVHTLACRSGDLWNNADSFRYAFERAHGDVTVTARVISVTNTSSWAKPGVMIRESLAAGSKHAFMSVTPGNGTAMQWRDSTDGGSDNSNTAGATAPYWVRISRAGNTLTGSYSADGVTWTQQSTATIMMGTDVYVGLSLCANNTGSTCTATFDNFTVAPLVNKGALVNAGVDQTVATSSVSLSGSVTDDGQPLAAPVLQWSQISGTGTTTFGNAAAAATTASFSSSGTYVLRLTANDGWVKTFDDVTVNTAITTVALATPDANAAEVGLDPGSFTVTRSGGSTAAALNVLYTLSGTATNGTDYQALSGTVTIPAGQTSATITVTPIDDFLQETGGETVILTVTADPSYGINGAGTGTVTIADNDVTPVVAITSPTVGSTSIPTGVGLLLEATATDDGQPSALVTTWSMVSGPGTVTFGDTHALNTTALFSANGTYVLRLSAYDGGVTTTADVTVNVGVTPGGTLAGYTYGSGGAGSYTTISSSSYSLSGASSGIDSGGTSDGFFMLGSTFSGDFDLKTRVASGTNISNSTTERAGLVVRLGTGGAANGVSAFVGMDTTPTEWGYWITRTTAGGANVRDQYTEAAMGLPTWCRLVRVGTTITGYHSDDGTTWTSRGTITMAGDVRAGLCWSSDSANSGTATFDNVSGFGYSGNVGPAVNAGVDQPVLLPANATLAGTASDDGKPVSPGALTTTWTKVSGPGTVTFGNASTPATSASFSQGGTYVLRLIGDDGEVKTFDDMTVTATSPLPVVSMTTPLPSASESGPVAGKFTISRSGSTLAALTVNVAMSGTATNGTDYTSVASTVTIPAGSASADVTITPTVDAVAEGDETAVLTLTADAAYTLGATVNGTVTIADLPVDAWKKTKFGASANDPAVAGDLADPDHDGVSNLLEYALGTDPLDGKTPMPKLKPGVSPALFHLDMPDPAASDVTYTVEGINLLGGTWTTLAAKSGTGPWSWLAGGTSKLTVGTPAGGRVGVDVGCPDSMAASPKYFFRLKAQRN
ncbi:DUF1349 domain-containing protein [Luteolibacter ambystomatis]|uniref:DUF1349 domain-containing protein n=1 Tax=Luteolibacter ambystomatis TaxID=2824561 RepID=A0A975PGG8_9BACT|nr:Calx-beta domain-containing protein [Luteolibacter ambystomatis]QUE52719.1 DUF1349 domain-containing protein [Luteolibacter ambystomatis]